ncbi:MAG TPA: nuclear transport factor 2 family protein [Gemmatimonadales bacterium]|nr:nuclear transport factor 2 family protein [Gemmatimonadales bacterium]
MNDFDPERFAAEWAAAWNARDLARVLHHFDGGVTFSTPKAVETVGRPSVHGIPELRSYWERALARITSLHFTVCRVVWDPARRELGIVYDRNVNGSTDRALELLRFGATGKVASGEVFYGVRPG